MTSQSPGPRRSLGALPLFVAIGAACLVGGFIVGWLTRGDGGTASVLPPVTAPANVTTKGVTTTATSPSPPATVDPATIHLAILNATSPPVAGLAARTATKAMGLGYVSPSAGNVSSQTGPTTVYFRTGKRAQAQRVGKDLGFTAIKPLPATGAVTTATPATADVVVVLASG
ncbi:MAG: LytR C-terminal domain-containing protein [Thermoleophilia bacterium]